MILYKAIKILILNICIEKFFDNLYFNTKILPKLKHDPSLRWNITWDVTSSGNNSVFGAAPPGVYIGRRTGKTVTSNLYGNYAVYRSNGDIDR